MELDDLKKIAKRGEDQFVEFKKNANEPAQIVEEVVGFSNSKGGSLFIGIDDSGALTGLKFAEDDATFLINYVNENIKPVPGFEYEIVQVTKKKSVLHFKIKSGKSKPYGVINHASNSSKVFYRINDECLQASRELKGILRGNKLESGQIIKYNELENEVLKIIEANETASKEFIRKNSKFTSRRISDCLIRLVVARVLNIIPAPGDDLYEFNKQI